MFFLCVLSPNCQVGVVFLSGEFQEIDRGACDNQKFAGVSSTPSSMYWTRQHDTICLYTSVVCLSFVSCSTCIAYIVHSIPNIQNCALYFVIQSRTKIDSDPQIATSSHSWNYIAETKFSSCSSDMICRDGAKNCKFVGIDVSADFLEQAKANMLQACPGLRTENVEMIQETYLEGLAEARRRWGLSLEAFL